MENFEHRVLRPCNTIFSNDQVPRWKQLGLNLSNLNTPECQSHPGQVLTSRHATRLSNDFFKSSTTKNVSKKGFFVPEPTKTSLKENGQVAAYAANTNQGLVRSYNEDRVSIILNISWPPGKSNPSRPWPQCSFFGVYDGHAGSACADFLRDNLHLYVVRDCNFPWNPQEALKNGFARAESEFTKIAERSDDKSGSWGVVVLVVGDMCFVANVGDSRAIMSGNQGRKVYPLTIDHKPTEQVEKKRILNFGGKIYQSQHQYLTSYGNEKRVATQLGPHRVLPGRLSVSRTFGDISAKLPQYGGKQNVVVALPDIKSFRITSEYDYILIGTDGIYDKLSNKDIIQVAWRAFADRPTENLHTASGNMTESVIREAMARQSTDNVTAVLIAFPNLQR